MRAREAGLAAGVIIVEVDEERGNALSPAKLLGVAGIAGVEIIVVRPELLTDGIVEHLTWLEQRQWKPSSGTDPQPEGFDDQIHVGDLEFDGPVGPCSLDGLGARIGDDHGRLQAIPRPVDQPCTFGGIGEPAHDPHPRRFAKRLLVWNAAEVLDRNPIANDLPIERARGSLRRDTCENAELSLGGVRPETGRLCETIERSHPVLRSAETERLEKRLALERIGIPARRRSVDRRHRFTHLFGIPAQTPNSLRYRAMFKRTFAHECRIAAVEQKRSSASELTGGARAADRVSMGIQFDQAVEAFRSGDLTRARTLAEAEVAAAASANAHHLLGLVRCRLGDAPGGIEHLRFAAEAEPTNPGFRIMLMRALIDAGRPAEVLGFPPPPPIRSAAALEEWRARGEAADAAQEPAAASIAWSTVAAAVPGDWKAWANLAAAFTRQNRWEDAVEALRNATWSNDSEPALRWSLGAALVEIDRYEEAIAALDEFDRLGGQTIDSALARGRCLLALIRIEEAEQAYRDAVALAPNNAEAVRELGLLLERTNNLGELDELLKKARSDGIPDEKLAHVYVMRASREGRTEEAFRLLKAVNPAEDPLGWNRVMCKVADRLGKADEAFAAAVEMNRLTRDFDTWRSRGAAYRKGLRELARTLVHSASLPQLKEPGRRKPAFLVGFPRSGTTLLDTFLMGHADTAVLEEVHLLGAAERQIGKVADLPRASVSVLERARRAYFAELDRHVPSGFGGLVVDKLPLNMLGGPFIEAMFPGAPIIFAQRHPCDAVLSGFMQSFVMNDAMASFLTIEDAADLYDAVMSGWQAMRQAFPLKVQTVRYERLVEDPESELRPLVEFLGLEWDPKMLAHTETARERGAIVTPSYDQVTEPLSTRPVGRWKRYRKQLEPVLPVLLPWAERLGYSD